MLERPLKQVDTDPPTKRCSMFSLMGWKHLNGDESKPLAEVMPDSRVTYKERKIVYIFLRSLMNMRCMVSSPPCSISCENVDGFSRGYNFYVFQFRFVPLFYLLIERCFNVLVAQNFTHVLVTKPFFSINIQFYVKFFSIKIPHFSFCIISQTKASIG